VTPLAFSLVSLSCRKNPPPKQKEAESDSCKHINIALLPNISCSRTEVQITCHRQKSAADCCARIYLQIDATAKVFASRDRMTEAFNMYFSFDNQNHRQYRWGKHGNT